MDRTRKTGDQIIAVNPETGLSSWSISICPGESAFARPPWTHGFGKGRWFPSEAEARAFIESKLTAPALWLEEADFKKVRAARDIIRWEEPGNRSRTEIEEIASTVEELGVAEIAKELRELFL